MEQSVIYCDNLGDSISKEEFGLLERSSIIYLENGEKKKVEYYEGRKMYDVTYYISGEENITDIFESLNPERNSYGNEFIHFIKKVKWHNYYIEEETSFANKKLSSVSKRLYDELSREICEQWYDIDTGQPKTGSTEKCFYDKSEDEKSLWINYESNGQIGLVTGKWVENTDRGWKGYMRGDMLDRYFPGFLEAYPYYRSTNFLPEPGQSINIKI
jgi:hypothetical protein